jgi:hypothetical protein
MDAHVGEADVRGSVARHTDSDRLQESERLTPEDGDDGCLRRSGIGVVIVGFLDPGAGPQAEQRQRQREQERHPPSPALELHVGGECRHRAPDRGGHREPHRGAERGERAVGGLEMPRRRFGDERGLAADLATGREPLDHPDDNEQHGGPDPGLRVGGQESHRHAAEAHAGERREEGLLPPEPVADVPEHDAAERTHEVGGAEHGGLRHAIRWWQQTRSTGPS